MCARIKLLSEEIRGQCADVPDISAVMCSSLMVPQFIVKATSARVRGDAFMLNMLSIMS